MVTSSPVACGLRPEPALVGVLWPWLAEVHVAGNQVCTGILVAPGWVVAATHCILRWVSPISWARGKNGEMGKGLLK